MIVVYVETLRCNNQEDVQFETPIEDDVYSLCSAMESENTHNTMSKNKLPNSLELDDWLKLVLEDLEQALGLVTTAFATRVKLGVQINQARTAELE